MIIYQISYHLGDLGVKVVSTSGDAPLRGDAVAPSTKVAETPKLHQKFPGPYGGGFLVNPVFAKSRTEIMAI